MKPVHFTPEQSGGQKKEGMRAMFVYADNAATTAMSKTAADAMLPALREMYGNPSSLHQKGRASIKA